jgi:hypothetical protein
LGFNRETQPTRTPEATKSEIATENHRVRDNTDTFTRHSTSGFRDERENPFLDNTTYFTSHTGSRWSSKRREGTSHSPSDTYQEPLTVAKALKDRETVQGLASQTLAKYGARENGHYAVVLSEKSRQDNGEFLLQEHQDGDYSNAMIVTGELRDGEFRVLAYSPANTVPRNLTMNTSAAGQVGRYSRQYGGTVPGYGRAAATIADGRHAFIVGTMNSGGLKGMTALKAVPGEVRAWRLSREGEVLLTETNNSIAIHKGSTRTTDSAGCVTIPPADYNSHLASLGKGEKVTVLVDSIPEITV